MNRRTTLVVILFILICSTVKAIDPAFSQFFLYSPYSNPAVVGSVNEPRLFLHYRNQWPEFGGTFVTYQGSFDQYIKRLHGGIGINVWHDQVGGAFSSTNIDLIYSYRSKINQKFTLQSALQASYVFSGTSIETVNGANFNLSPETSSSQPDFAIGFLGISRYSQVGLAIHHLNINGAVSFNASSVVIPMKISLFYTRNIKIVNERKVVDDGYLISPSIMLQKQAQSYSIQYGAGVTKRDVFLGVYLNNNLPFQFNAAIFAIGYTFNNLRLGYSYDYMFPSIYNYTPITGAHEITLVKIFPVDPRKKLYGAVKCPDFKND
jgi:type IX secretion system PorP/SprF family membrane protein